MWLLAAAVALACDEDGLSLVESFPGNASNGVPRDTRGVAVVEGYGDPGEWSVELVGPDGPVDAVYSRWGRAVDSPERLRYHVVTTPRNPLDAATEYHVVVRRGEEIIQDQLFRTGLNVADPLQGAPMVEVVDVSLAKPGRDECDWDEVETVRLRFTPAQGDPTALSLLVLYQGEEGSLLDAPTRTLRAPPDGAPFTIDLRQPATGLPLCFAVAQENAAGDRAVGDWSCGLRPTSEGTPEPEDVLGREVGGACATPGAASVGLLGLAAAAGLIRRRRGGAW